MEHPRQQNSILDLLRRHGNKEEMQAEVQEPKPPAREVRKAEAVSFIPFATETVALQRGLTLLKGKASVAASTSSEVSASPHSDLLAGKYEGGFKLWECSLDLIEALRVEIQDGHLSFRGKDILELGCGHGLPGIFACIKGAATTHFQDFNESVLINLTIPNVEANLTHVISNQQSPKAARLLSPSSSRDARHSMTPFHDSEATGPESGSPSTPRTPITPKSPNPNLRTKFFAGDWEDLGNLLSTVSEPEGGLNDSLQLDPTEERGETAGKTTSHEECSDPGVTGGAWGTGKPAQNGGSTAGKGEGTSEAKEDLASGAQGQREVRMEREEICVPLALHRTLEGSPAFSCKLEQERVAEGAAAAKGGYDVILTAETVYSVASLPKLLALVKRCLRKPYGVLYLAGKKHYFGVGGGTRKFMDLLKEDGVLHGRLLQEIADGASNVREVWKIFYKP